MRIYQWAAAFALSCVASAAIHAAEIKLSGELSEKPAGAAPGAVATLTPATKSEHKSYTLFATGDAAKQLEALAKKKAKVDLSGAAVGNAVNVSQFAEPKAMKKKEGS